MTTITANKLRNNTHPMRILQVYDHGALSCGVLSVILAWHKQLATFNIRFDYLFSHRRFPARDEELKALGGNVYYINNNTSMGNLLVFIKKVKKFIKEHACEYDAIHLHTATFSYPYLFYAKKYQIPVRIVHAHSAHLGNTKLSSIRNIFFALPLRFLANQFLACSQPAALAWFYRFGILNYKIIHNGIETQLYKQSPEKRQKIRICLGLKSDDIAVVHISNMADIKNIPFVLKSFKELLSIHNKSILFLIGKASLPKKISALITKYRLTSHIVNLGFRTDIPELLQGMDVCIMPSRSEGLGIAAIEAQASGVPCIISNGFPDEVMVTNKITKMDYNSVAWAKAMFEQAATRTEDIDDSLLANRFDSAHIAQQILRFYEQIYLNPMQ